MTAPATTMSSPQLTLVHPVQSDPQIRLMLAHAKLDIPGITDAELIQYLREQVEHISALAGIIEAQSRGSDQRQQHDKLIVSRLREVVNYIRALPTTETPLSPKEKTAKIRRLSNKMLKLCIAYHFVEAYMIAEDILMLNPKHAVASAVKILIEEDSEFRTASQYLPVARVAVHLKDEQIGPDMLRYLSHLLSQLHTQRPDVALTLRTISLILNKARH